MSPPSHDDRNPGASAQGPGASGPLDEDVSAWVDGELSDDELEAFEAELERNASLRGRVDEIREVSEWLADEGPTEAPMGFANRVMARIDEEHPADRTWWTWLRRPLGLPLEGVVVALSAALVLLLVLPRADRTANQERAARQSRLERTVEPPQNEAVATERDAERPGERVTPSEEPPTLALPPPTTRKGAPAEKAVVTSKRQDEGTARAESPHAPESTGPTTPPTDAYHVPPPSEVDSPLAQAPLRKRAPPTPEPARDRRTLPFEVTSDDPDMLARVLKLSARFGGAFDAAGREIADPTLGSGTREIFVHVPQKRLHDFESQLRALGYEVAAQGRAGLLASDRVTVRLQLTLAPPRPDGKATASEAVSTQ